MINIINVGRNEQLLQWLNKLTQNIYESCDTINV